MNGHDNPEFWDEVEHRDELRENPQMPKYRTRQWWVLSILSSGYWMTTVELTGPMTGTEGLKRLRELRAAGWPIEGPERIEGSAQRRYRLNLSRLAHPLVMG